MKSAALLASFALLGFAFQSSLPPAVDGHVKNLQAAKGLKVEFSMLKVSGGAEKVSVLYAKPNMFRIDSTSTLKISDGKTLWTLDKQKNTFTEGVPVLSPTAERDVWAWSAFFDADTLKGASGSLKGQREIRGVKLNEYTLRLKGGETASLFVDPANGIARGYSKSDAKTGDIIIIATEVTTAKEAADAKMFTFVPPAGAKKEEPKPVPAEVLFAEVQPIFAARCSGCHSSGNPKGGLATDSYEGVMSGVKAGDSAGSKLVRVISGPRPSMPKAGGPLSETDVQKIKDWVDSGAKK